MKGVSRPRPTKLPAPLQIRLPAELHAKLDAYAASQQLTRSEAVRQLIEVGLVTLDERR
jgi:hypothetical protein